MFGDTTYENKIPIADVKEALALFQNPQAKVLLRFQNTDQVPIIEVSFPGRGAQSNTTRRYRLTTDCADELIGKGWVTVRQTIFGLDHGTYEISERGWDLTS